MNKDNESGPEQEGKDWKSKLLGLFTGTPDNRGEVKKAEFEDTRKLDEMLSTEISASKILAPLLHKTPNSNLLFEWNTFRNSENFEPGKKLLVKHIDHNDFYRWRILAQDSGKNLRLSDFVERVIQYLEQRVKEDIDSIPDSMIIEMVSLQRKAESAMREVKEREGIDPEDEEKYWARYREVSAEARRSLRSIYEQGAVVLGYNSLPRAERSERIDPETQNKKSREKVTFFDEELYS